MILSLIVPVFIGATMLLAIFFMCDGWKYFLISVLGGAFMAVIVTGIHLLFR